MSIKNERQGVSFPKQGKACRSGVWTRGPVPHSPRCQNQGQNVSRAGQGSLCRCYSVKDSLLGHDATHSVLGLPTSILTLFDNAGLESHIL